MTSQEIGKLIKAKRKSMKLTQSQVVDGVITRNMLSQIESGAALPSFKTLSFLTDRLGLSFEVFDTSTDSFKNYIAAKNHFNDGAFSAALGIAETVTESDPLFDEFALLKTRSAIEIAESAYIRRDIDVCIDYAERAISYASVGLYANDAFAEQAENLLALCKNVKANKQLA